MNLVTRNGCDGSHRGLSDWYSDLEQGIADALAKGPDYEWTTGWYSSKHEIASAKITCKDGGLLIEASVSDDFDTEGYGCGVLTHTTDLDTLRKKIDEIWDEADEDRRENEMFVGYSVLRGGSWVETYIKDAGYDLDHPPGDNYFEWGWQGEDILEEDVREALASWAMDHDDGEFTYKEYTIKAWSD